MFKGRIGVAQYWIAVIALILLVLLANVALIAVAIPALAFAVKSLANPGNALGFLLIAGLVGGLIGALPSLVALPFMIGLQVRRYHDIGITGWVWVGLLLLGSAAALFFPIFAGPVVPGARTLPPFSPEGVAVTAVLGIAGLVLLCWPGTKGPNAFGEPFRYRSAWAAIRGDQSLPDAEPRKSHALPILILIGAILIAAALFFALRAGML